MIKKIKKLLIISIIIIFLQIPSFARYYEMLNKFKINGSIAEPIVTVEKMQDTINLQINKDTKKNEYYFCIKNYKMYDNNTKKVSEVDLYYNIEIKSYNNNFPIKYELYDCTTNQQIYNNNIFKMEKNYEYEKKYKLVIDLKSKDLQVEENDKIDIIVKVSQ